MTSNTSPWNHLPNAAHIDKVLASLKANPVDWVNAYKVDNNRATPWPGQAAYNAAWCISSGAVRNTMFEVESAAAYGLCDAACDVLMALIAYDDSAHLLESTPEEIQLLIALGHPHAILMLPAVVVFQHINELSYDN